MKYAYHAYFFSECKYHTKSYRTCIIHILSSKIKFVYYVRSHYDLPWWSPSRVLATVSCVENMLETRIFLVFVDAINLFSCFFYLSLARHCCLVNRCFNSAVILSPQQLVQLNSTPPLLCWRPQNVQVAMRLVVLVQNTMKSVCCSTVCSLPQRL